MKEIIIKTPRQKRSKLKFSSILQATARVLACDGFQKTTTANIAIEAEVGIASVYDYFSCKEALVIALVDNELKQCLAQVLEKAEQGINAEDSLQALIEEGIGFAIEQQVLLRTLFIHMPEYIAEINLVQSREAIQAIALQYAQQHQYAIKPLNSEQDVNLLLYSLINIVLGFQFRIAIMQDQSFDKGLVVEQLMVIVRPLIFIQP